MVHADQVLEFAQLVAVASEVNARWPSVLNAPFLVASLLDFDIDMHARVDDDVNFAIHVTE